jgi:xanthine dehydrogenase accessory factor
MKKLYDAALDLLGKKESFEMVTIFDSSGSAPRSKGAKMIVRKDGSIVGTVGGGRLEADAITTAKEAMAAQRSVIQAFDLTSKNAAGSDMICGGSGQVLIDFIDARDENNLKVYGEAARLVEHREKGWLVTVLGETGEAGDVTRQQCLVKPNGDMIGNLSIDPYLLEKLIAGPAKIAVHSEVFDEYRFLVEPLQFGGSLYLFGAGHVSRAIAPLSESVGFKTTVIDDRASYANRERFPEAAEVMVIGSFEKMPELPIDEDSYLVIITRGHLHDKHVLEQVLRSKAAYIGMIGSRTKRDLIYKEAMDHGFTGEELKRVFSPIGTDIGAETPEELAISIVGELVKVRSEKYGPKKKAKNDGAAPCCRIEPV